MSDERCDVGGVVAGETRAEAADKIERPSALNGVALNVPLTAAQVAAIDAELAKELRTKAEAKRAAASAPLASPVRRVTVRVSVERSSSAYSHSDECEDEFCFEGPFPVAFLASQVRLAASLSAERIERMLGGGAA